MTYQVVCKTIATTIDLFIGVALMMHTADGDKKRMVGAYITFVMLNLLGIWV